MAGDDDTKLGGLRQPGESDVPAGAIIYRLRRDALMIVSNMNRGCELPNMDTVKRQIVFIQGQLCEAAISDPSFPECLKGVVVDFHVSTVRASIKDKRGARRRGQNTCRSDS